MNRLRNESIRFLILGALFLGSFAVAPLGPQGCAYLGTPQGQVVMASGETIAHVAVTAAATTYGGPVAGQLAGSGLDALATVLQSYVGQQIPPKVVAASPGVKGVGKAVAPLVKTSKPVSQADVNRVWKAAKIAKSK